MLNKCIYKLPDKFQHTRKKRSKGKIYELTLEEKSVLEKELYNSHCKMNKLLTELKQNPSFNLADRNWYKARPKSKQEFLCTERTKLN